MIDLHNGDCLEIMDKLISEGIKVDAVITDPPYGTTACKWDSVIPFDEMWKRLNKLLKETSPVILFGSEPFSSSLVCSNIKNFRHSWIYQKRCASNFAQAKYAPMKEHENILVFGKNKVNYFPIMEERVGSGKERAKYKYTEKSRHQTGEFVGKLNGNFDEYTPELRYPSSVRAFNNRASGDRGYHPTQKPVALMEYLVNTYTNEGDTVLDFTMGSGTTGVACKNLNRNFIGIEIEEKYFKIAENRINAKNINYDLFKDK